MLREDLSQLERAVETARKQKNIRAANRLIEYLERSRIFSLFGGGDQMGDPINEGIDESFDSFPVPKFLEQILFGEEDGMDDEIAKPKPRTDRKRTLRDPFTLDIFDDGPLWTARCGGIRQ